MGLILFGRRSMNDETPAEKLMSDIRRGKARQSLRRPKLKTSTLVQSLEKVASAKEEEKHAWAIISNGLKKLTHLHQQEFKCLLVTDVDNIIINADGDIDDATFTKDDESSSRPEMLNLATGKKS